jgi:hypothetical protein
MVYCDDLLRIPIDFVTVMLTEATNPNVLLETVAEVF